MQFTRDYLAGFFAAVDELGRHGGYLHKDWSEPYKHLRSVYDRYEIEKPEEIAGMKIVVSEAVAKDVIEFHHADGRIDRFKLPP